MLRYYHLWLSLNLIYFAFSLVALSRSLKENLYHDYDEGRWCCCVNCGHFHPATVCSYKMSAEECVITLLTLSFYPTTKSKSSWAIASAFHHPQQLHTLMIRTWGLINFFFEDSFTGLIKPGHMSWLCIKKMLKNWYSRDMYLFLFWLCIRKCKKKVAKKEKCKKEIVG